MERACDGDARAFEALFRRLAPQLYRYVLRRVRSPSLAEEVAQTALYKLWSARDTFQRGARVEPWAYQITHNAMIDAIRAQKRRRDRVTAEGDAPEPPPVLHEGDALDGLDDAQQRLLESCIQALPPEQRDALIAMKVEGRTAREIAAREGLSVSAIKVRAFRAYQTLRTVFGQSLTLKR
jgi:RNA polymerase sigma-70 factor (ECF subfamily)